MFKDLITESEIGKTLRAADGNANTNMIIGASLTDDGAATLSCRLSY